MIFYANIVNTLHNRNKDGYNQKRQLIRLPSLFQFNRFIIPCYFSTENFLYCTSREFDTYIIMRIISPTTFFKPVWDFISFPFTIYLTFNNMFGAVFVNT